jgi:hypothetical protein
MYSYKNWSYFNFEYVLSLLILESCTLFVLLCFSFLLDHVWNYALAIGKGAWTEIQAWKDFLCYLKLSCLVSREWGMELEEFLVMVGGISLALTSIPWAFFQGTDFIAAY